MMTRAALSLLAAGAAFSVLNGAGEARTTFAKTGECKITITVPIELYTVPADSLDEARHGANPDYADPNEQVDQDYADALEERAEALWNGPSAAEAETIAGTLDIEQDADESASEAIQDNARDIREEWNRYANEAGADQNCTWGTCCAIQVDVDVRTRAHDDDPTEGYHQIGIMGPGFRSFVYKQPNPDVPADEFDRSNPDHWVRGDKVTTSGIWANRGTTQRAPAAHEIGHLMGLPDQYSDAGGTREGHHHDVMATNNGFPFTDAIDQLIESSGLECDCCDDDDEYNSIMRDYSLDVANAGDAIVRCDIEAMRRQIERFQQLRRRLMASDSRPRQKAVSAALIDAQIKGLRRAIENCGGADESGQAALSLPDMTVSLDSGEWCEYRPEGPASTPLIPIPPDGMPPPGGFPGTPTTPGQNPTDAPDGTPPGGGDPGEIEELPPVTGRPRPETGDGDPTPVTVPGGIDTPGQGGGEEDGDDPGDEGDDDTGQPTVPVFVKARNDVLQGDGTVRSEETPGQIIRLIPDDAANPDLPGPGVARNDDGYDEDPLQCVTDQNGNCRIDVDPTRLRVGMSIDFEPAGYRMEVQATDRESANLIMDRPLTQQEREDIQDLAVDGDTIDITPLKLGVGYRYRLDWGLKANYAFGLVVGDGLIEENVCRDKQPGPPSGWVPQGAARETADDLPAQTIDLGDAS